MNFLKNMKINYVVACYITDNLKKVKRTNIYHSIDKLFAIKCHIHALNIFDNPDIVKATFVVNKSDCINVGELEQLTANCNVPIEVVYRDNWGLSYGAWEYIIRKTLHHDYDYYFLTEDDYCLANDKFYEVFYKKFTNKTAMVCGLYDGHPAVSYGLVSKQICQNVLNDRGEIFETYNMRAADPSYEYNGWQGYFHMNFINSGYEVKDVADVSPVMYKRSYDTLLFSGFNFKLNSPGHFNIIPIL